MRKHLHIGEFSLVYRQLIFDTIFERQKNNILELNLFVFKHYKSKRFTQSEIEKKYH